MPDLKTSIEVTPVPEGMLYTPADYTSLQAVIDNTTNGLIDALGGPNFLPASNPVTITPTSGMTVQCGGSVQYMIAQGRVLDVCPATNITLAAAGGADRVDLIAVKATRTNGSQTITRNVRSDSATPSLVILSGTLSGGSATVNLPAGYTTPPKVVGVTPLGADSAGKVDVTSVSTTQAFFASTDSTDSRAFSFLVYGQPTGYAGVSTTITLQENQPAWTYVQGTNTSQPATPSGYDAFATIYVHASESSVSSADITYLFPVLPALNEENMELDQLQLGDAGTENRNALFIGNNSSEGGAAKQTRLSVNGSTSVASIVGSLLMIDDYLVAYKLALDTNGNLGILGALYLGTPGTPKEVGIEIANASTNSGTQQKTRIGVGAVAENTVSTVDNSLLGFADEGHSFLICFDLSGNIGIAGTLHAGSSTYGPTSASINGGITAQSFTASTITGLLLAHGASVQSDANGALYLNAAGGQNVNVSGNIDAGAMTLTGSLSVGGTIGITGALTAGGITSNGRITAANGAPSVPAGFSFDSELGFDTGMFSTADGDLRFLVNNVLALHFAGGINAEFLGNVAVDGTFSVTGAATFSTAPTMSGANIASGTIPTAALASIPVGGVVPFFSRVNTAVTSQTITLATTLPTGNWRIRARAQFDTSGAGITTLTGVDGGTTWDTATSTNDTDQPHNAELVLFGNAVAGNQPSVTLSTTATGYTGYGGEFIIEAIRTS